jgi:hypothetical protein
MGTIRGGKHDRFAVHDLVAFPFIPFKKIGIGVM